MEPNGTNADDYRSTDAFACSAEQLQQEEQNWQQHPQADLHMVLMKCFLHVMREQHLQRVQLLARGLSHVKHLPFSASMPCCRWVQCCSTACNSLLMQEVHACVSSSPQCLLLGC